MSGTRAPHEQNTRTAGTIAVLTVLMVLLICAGLFAYARLPESAPD
jgi:hypothetical protein